MALVRRAPVFLRALMLFISCSIPPAAVGGALFDWRGAGIAAVIVLGVLLFLLRTAEDAMAFQLEAESRIPKGLETTFERAVSQVDPYLRHLPELRIFSHPRAQAIYLRALGGDGSIYLSRGLLAGMDEERLREVIAEAYRRVRRPGSRLQTLCAILTLWLYRIAPAESVERTPMRTLIFWMLWPASRWLDTLCGEVAAARFTGLCRTALSRSFPLPGDISL